ncbi:MAG: protein-L-isoaspartate(D-aspartate) O-methyltransferase [Elusimicrobia bacterium]|nr:protein-L-isoaspartate(D-aspartate) O-methyltransferase [Elusimicrobiota bacterium]
MRMENILAAVLAAGLVFILVALLRPKLKDRRGGADMYDFKTEREAMISRQLKDRGINDPLVLDAMLKVPRHEFVPEKMRGRAYEDHPLSIGHDQTISQPYIVAYMTQALELKAGAKVLEIGTGSGYQAAVLACLTRNVFSVEIICELAQAAGKTLARLGYSSVRTRCADGYKGWPEEAPFDAIILTAAPEQVPQPLLDQLKPGGRLVMPIGPALAQDLILIRRTPSGFKRETLLPVIFVPMTGEVKKTP